MPGTLIRERTARVPRTLPTDTGVLFLAGPADRGPANGALVVQNMQDFVTKFGDRVTYSLAYDMLEAFFQEGGSKAYFSRILGPAYATATVNLPDAGAAVSLVASASSPGTWGNALNVAVLAGDAAGEFKLQITHDTDTSINITSPSLVDQAAAIAWAANTDYIRLAAGASTNDPAVAAAASLAGGADDRNNISDATAATALANFTKGLGPGQVAYAGRTTSVAHGQLLDHAAANNRVALLDPPDTTVKATLLTTASAARALNNARFGAIFGPWLDIPALSLGGTTRAIPASSSVAGVMARNDSRGHTPNEPAAGDLGILNYALGARATFTDSDAEDLNNASVNLIRVKANDLKVYGYRTAVDKVTNPTWWPFGNVRLYMGIAAKADNILERFVLRQIDGRGLVFKELQGQLTSMLIPYYEKGSLYGATFQDAAYVDTSSAVNTAETIEAGEIHAVIELVMSPMGETVILDIVKSQISG